MAALLHRLAGALRDQVLPRLTPPLLEPGEPCPPWRLSDQDGVEHSDGGAWQILVFYPTDDTPGCTRQLQDLTAHRDALRDAGVQAFGVNPAGAASHQAFAASAGLDVPLLVDDGGSLARALGARIPGLGRIVRTVYVFAPDGAVSRVERGAPSAQSLLDHIALGARQP